MNQALILTNRAGKQKDSTAPCRILSGKGFSPFADLLPSNSARLALLLASNQVCHLFSDISTDCLH
jgi:hypothetical protein